MFPDSINMPRVTSGPVPVRFIVLFLGPEAPKAFDPHHHHHHNHSSNTNHGPPRNNFSFTPNSSGSATSHSGASPTAQLLVNRSPMNMFDIARTFSSMFMFKVSSMSSVTRTSYICILRALELQNQMCN